MGNRQATRARSDWVARQRWWHWVGRVLRLPGFVRVGGTNARLMPERREASRGLCDAAAVGWPGVATPERIAEDEAPAPSIRIRPHPIRSRSGWTLAVRNHPHPDEDETVHSTVPTAAIQRPAQRRSTGYVGGVSRETSEPPTLIGSGGLIEAAGQLGAPGLRPRPRVDSPSQPTGRDASPARARWQARTIQSRSRRPPCRSTRPRAVPNTIVSAAGHRGGKAAEIDSVRQSREPEDPPLAQEARRAVQILNPSGEIHDAPAAADVGSSACRTRRAASARPRAS